MLQWPGVIVQCIYCQHLGTIIEQVWEESAICTKIIYQYEHIIE